MEFLIMIALYADFFESYRFDNFSRNDAYCQNIYWHPDALEEMHIAWCDVTVVEKTIYQTKTWRS